MGEVENNELKSRVWAFIIYPDSCGYDYVGMLEKLSNLGVPCAVSPLHIPSKNSVEVQNEKKEHYHRPYFQFYNLEIVVFLGYPNAINILLENE